MDIEFDGLMSSRKFAELSEIPNGCNIRNAKWLYKWKSDSNGKLERSKACMVAVGYSNVEGVYTS